MDAPQIDTTTLCMEIQISKQEAGFRIGDQVKHAGQVGRLLAFRCANGEPGALLDMPDPRSRLGATVFRTVPLAQLVKVK